MRWALVLGVLAACGGGDAPAVAPPAPVPAPPADAIAVEQDPGPAKVTVKVWPKEPTLGDSIWLRLEVEPDDGVVVELPFDQAALGRFSVLRYAPETSAATYELGAPMSGRHRIPPLRVVAGGTEILTDEIPITVGAVAAARTDQALHPARGALDTHVGGPRWWPVAAAGAGVLAIGGGVVAWLAMRKRRVQRGRESAWELAMQRLAQLEARGAPGGDDADAWFVELSAIVRAYVEGRWNLRAPELTTEEFLLEARRVPEVHALGPFLEQCDRVKFAGWRPDAAQSIELLGVARTFVKDTEPREVAA